MCGLWSLEAQNETEKTPTLSLSLSLSLSPIVGKRMQQIMSGFQSVQSTLLQKKPMKKSNGFL
jgi:hypothetical protein